MRRVCLPLLLAALVASLPGRACGEQDGTVLRDGAPVQATLLRGQRTWQARVEVPADGVGLGLALFGDRDVDLYVRHGRPVEDDLATSADASAFSTSARETITLSPVGEVRLRPGTWFVTVEHPQWRAAEAHFTIVAFVDRGAEPRTLLPGRPALLTVPGSPRERTVRTYLPQGATQAVVTLSSGRDGTARFELAGPDGYERSGRVGGRLVLSRADAPGGNYAITLSPDEGQPPRGYTARLTWAFPDGTTLPRRPAPLLEPGEPTTFLLGGRDRGDVQHLRIPVREGTGGFVLEATNPRGLDVDLYVSRSAPPQDGIEDAGWLAFSTSNQERLVVAGAEPLPGGVYHGEVVLNQDAQPVQVTVRVRLLEPAAGPFSWGTQEPPRLAPESWLTGRVRIAESAVSWHAIDLPAGVRELHAQLLDANTPLELILARRSDGQIVHRAVSPLVNESLRAVFASPLPRPDRFYLGVLNHDGWEQEEVTYRIAVAVNAPPSLPQNVTWPPAMRLEDPTIVERLAASTVEITLEDSSGGSGVLVSPKGLVLSCLHCLEPLDG
ncbi:MAG: hypothetical protein ACYTG6_04575, partial [Planctomycetota bacterium]